MKIDPTTQSIADALGLETTAGIRALAVALDNIKLLDSKQKDYGSRNISDFGSLGVTVRINDKAQRLRNLLFARAGRGPKHESILDSFKDVANYGLIGLLIELGHWPNE